MQNLIIVLNIITYILIFISFIFLFKTKKYQKVIRLLNEDLNKKIRTNNIMIQSLQEQLEAKRKEYNKILDENKELRQQLASYEEMSNKINLEITQNIKKDEIVDVINSIPKEEKKIQKNKTKKNNKKENNYARK